MYISRLTISNIRCFPSVDLSPSKGINVIVGENNSGKSTLLGALLLMQAPQYGIEAVRHGTQHGTVEIEVSDLDTSLFQGQIRQHLIDREGRIPWIRARYLFSSVPASQSRATISPDGALVDFGSFPQSQPGNFLFPYLSLRRTAGLQESVSSQNAFEVGGTHQHLQAKIDRIYSDPTIRPDFEAACLSVLGFLVSTFPTANGKASGLIIDGRNQRYILLREMGAGVANALGLIVDLLVAENKVFLVEELENDMHPQALRQLLRLVQHSASLGNQFFISTHSNIVVRELASVEGSNVFHIERVAGTKQPESRASLVPQDAVTRRALLASLGYDLIDYDLYSAWLLLEESSAEQIVREFLIPWFTPGLVGRLKTIAAQGAADVEPRFIDLQRLMTFVHLEPIYREKSWVLCDGDLAGQQCIEKLRTKFPTWPTHHFSTLDAPAFEHFYPDDFSSRVADTLGIVDASARRTQKATLLREVVAWLREDQLRGRAALQKSAAPVISKLKEIEAAILTPTSNSYGTP
jgi:predicted ATPase